MTLVNLLTFISSRGASISSKIQKGLGLYWYIAKRSAIAVKDFSPADNILNELFFLPGGCAKIFISEFNGSSISLKEIVPLPPRKNVSNITSKLSLILLKVSENCFFATLSIFLIASFKFSSDSTKSLFWDFNNCSLVFCSLYSSDTAQLIGPIASILLFVFSTLYDISDRL